jgi:hypothetical protein
MNTWVGDVFFMAIWMFVKFLGVSKISYQRLMFHGSLRNSVAG